MPEQAVCSLSSLLKSIANKTIVCVGDAMIDSYITGSIEKISREAPIPVLKVTDEKHALGGAANVAANIIGLGGKSHFIAMIGDDSHGNILRNLITEHDGLDAHLIKDSTRPTSRVNRCLANNQHLFRFDYGTSSPATPSSRTKIVDQYRQCLRTANGVILSDYGRGCLPSDVTRSLIALARERQIPLAIDPRGSDYSAYTGADILTPSVEEVELACGHPCPDLSSLVQAGQTLAQTCQANILITRGPKGMLLIRKEPPFAPEEYSTFSQEVIDVCGAGDTVVAVIGMALAAGITLKQAIPWANYAAGQVIKKMGTAHVNKIHLLAGETCPYWHANTSMTEVQNLVDSWRHDKLSVGFTNGCFDILHAGHIHVLSQSKSRCDRLIVGVNSDASVRQLKGQNRPIQPIDQRIALLRSLRMIDALVIFDDETPHSIITSINPDLLTKGADYSIKDMIGADYVQARGGHIYQVPLIKGLSTTQIIRHLNAQQSTSSPKPKRP